MKEGSLFKIHWGWVVLGSCFVTLFINYSIRIGAYSVLLPEMVKDLRLHMAQAGMIRAAYFLTYILFSPLMGWLMDRLGGRFVISSFCFFLGAGTILMGFSSDLLTGIIFHGVVGVGAAAIWTPVAALIQKWFGEKQRGLALGILSPSYALGFGLMGIVLPIIVKNYNWRYGWYLLGIAGLLLIGMNLLLLRDDPEKMGLLPWGETSKGDSSSGIHEKSISPIDILKKRPFWLISISYFLISVGVYIVSDFLVTYGVMELKVPYLTASSFITIMAMTSIMGGFIWMTISDFLGRARTLILTDLLLTGSILLIIFAKGDIGWLRFGVGCFGFFYGPIFPLYAACARDYFEKGVAGTVIGLFTIFYGIGAMLGPILGGYLSDLTQTFRWSYGLGAFCAWVSAIVISALGKPLAHRID